MSQLVKGFTSFLILVILGAVVLGGITLVDTYYESQLPPEESNPVLSGKESCMLYEGTYLEEYSECEGLSLDQCTSAGGTFSECESACRHNPEAELCVLSCVPVCSFN